MKRTAYNALLRWKNSPSRKPLILQGARQVGKTWLMKHFGAEQYRNVVYANFDSSKTLTNYFEADLNPDRIIAALEAEFACTITPGQTLILFDEVQESPRALNALKYFCENTPHHHIIAAGSFLGVAMHGGFPVGKVDWLTIHPLSFYEFLDAIGEERLADAARAIDIPLLSGLSEKFTAALKTYFHVGGMPASVFAFSQRRDLNETREIQNGILDSYTADFSKHIKGVTIPKVKMIWDSIPAHLSREKKKFIYKELKEGARASAFEDALDWLVRAGLVYRVGLTETPHIPLPVYQAHDAFKLFALDVGLLSAMCHLDIRTFFQPDHSVFTDFKGALTEQYILQELKTAGRFPVCYWTNASGKAEVDFLIQIENDIIPIEVKSDIHTRSRSLDVYIDKHKPAHAIRFSLKNPGVSAPLHSIPLYAAASFADFLEFNHEVPVI